MIRKGELFGLQAARRLVSDAEREALDRAEELRCEAERLLEAVAASQGIESEPAPVGVTEPAPGTDSGINALRAELEALRAEVREATRRSAHLEEQVGLLRAAQGDLRAEHDALRHEVDSSGGSAGMAMDEDEMSLLAGAAKEAEQLLGQAMSAVAHETARVRDAREEAEKIRLQALEEAERIRSEARDEARRRFAEEAASLKVAMEQTWSTLEQLLGSPEHPG